MKIAFDGRTISGNKTGVGVYTDNLLKGLAAIDKGNTYNVFVLDMPSYASPQNFRFIKTNVSHKSHPRGELWESVFLPYFFIKEDIDVFHSPTFHLPLFTGRVKKIVTMHDLITLKFPQTYPQSFASYARWMMKMAVRVADAIIVPSKSTREDVLKIFSAEESKIYVIPEAVKEGLHPVDDETYLSGIKGRYNLPDDFILFVSTIEPRKNLECLIRAYFEIRKGGIRHKLVICGGKGWLKEYEKIIKIITELCMEEDIFFTGYVPDEDMAGIYSLAALFVYPSFYEGFGLPPLEAMACGCPVIASNASSIPEVVGEAGILIDPSDIQGLSYAICRVLGNEDIKIHMKMAGIERACQFSWTKVAADTLEVYKGVL